MGNIESRLENLGLTLPAALVPPGNFQLVKVVNGFSDLIVELWGDAAATLAPRPARGLRRTTCRSSSTRSRPSST